MRLMEVDEAANHIKELVDPDANIIWGSAFNNDLEGTIRVSVVATGIDVEEATQAPPLQAKVFAFPGARGETARTAEAAAHPASEPLPAPEAEPEAAPAAERIVLTPPEAEAAPGVEDVVSFIDETVEAPAELTLDQPLAEDEGDELLLGAADVPAETGDTDEAAPEVAEEATGRRSWLTRDDDGAAEASAPAPREGGTLFERMSNIARGAAKARVEDEEGPRLKPARDPLDIPRFLNRQNNQ
jgi:cell division protein FtsZ